jgi:hypothetical protein
MHSNVGSDFLCNARQLASGEDGKHSENDCVAHMDPEP